MGRSLNKTMLIGNVGAEPEVRSTTGETRVAKVSLATSDRWTDRGGQEQERTEWHRLTFWGKLADVVERYVHKGDRLYVEGEIRYSQSEHEGVTRYYTDIHVREMVMLGSPNGGPDGRSPAAASSSRQNQPAPSSGSNPFDEYDDDLPF